MTAKFSEIKRPLVSEEVASSIIEMVMRGELKPGESLPPERELAEMLGVGRPAVREALRALHMMNIVDIKHGDGTRISSLNPEGMMEPFGIFLSVGTLTRGHIFEARRVLECGIAALAARHITDEQLGRLEECVRFAEGCADDPDAFREMDVRLHSLIVESVNNPVLKILVVSISKLGYASRKVTGQVREVRRQSMEDHKRIVAALRRRDPAAAYEAMSEHLHNVERLSEQADNPSGEHMTG